MWFHSAFCKRAEFYWRVAGDHLKNGVWWCMRFFTRMTYPWIICIEGHLLQWWNLFEHLAFLDPSSLFATVCCQFLGPKGEYFPEKCLTTPWSVEEHCGVSLGIAVRRFAKPMDDETMKFAATIGFGTTVWHCLTLFNWCLWDTRWWRILWCRWLPHEKNIGRCLCRNACSTS